MKFLAPLIGENQGVALYSGVRFLSAALAPETAAPAVGRIAAGSVFGFVGAVVAGGVTGYEIGRRSHRDLKQGFALQALMNLVADQRSREHGVCHFRFPASALTPPMPDHVNPMNLTEIVSWSHEALFQ